MSQRTIMAARRRKSALSTLEKLEKQLEREEANFSKMSNKHYLYNANKGFITQLRKKVSEQRLKAGVTKEKSWGEKNFGSGPDFADSLKIASQFDEPSKESLKLADKTKVSYTPSRSLYGDKYETASKFGSEAAERWGKRKKSKEELEILATSLKAQQDINKGQKVAATSGTKTDGDQQIGALLKETQEKIKELGNKSSEPTNVFTRHYKTGEALGVMTKNQRDNYEKEAAGRTFEGEMEKAGLAKDDPRRETKYTSKSWQRKQLQIKQQQEAAKEAAKKEELLINKVDEADEPIKED